MSTSILIFKTNIQSKKDLRGIHKALSSLPEISYWNVDREDIDKILRVESKKHIVEEIKQQILQAGYFCEELK